MPFIKADVKELILQFVSNVLCYLFLQCKMDGEMAGWMNANGSVCR